MDHFRKMLGAYRRVARAAARGLQSAEHQLVPGQVVPRDVALQHVLYQLDHIENTLNDFDRLRESDKDRMRGRLETHLLAQFGVVLGILWAQGIGTEPPSPDGIVDKKV